MGIDGNICADAKAESGKRVPFPNQKKVAVDLLIPIARCLENDAAANMFHRSPAVPLFHPLLKYLERFHSMLIDSRFIPIYVYRMIITDCTCRTPNFKEFMKN